MTRLIPSPSVVNRGLIVAVGRYGARTLAHLWPRLRSQDDQRQHLHPDLPSLRRLLSISLILPEEEGGFVAGRPDPNEWNESGFQHRVIARTSRLWDTPSEHDGGGSRDNLIQRSLARDQTWEERPGTETDPTRHTYFQGATEDRDERLGRHLLEVAHRALIDEDAPGSEMSRFAVFVIAALRDRFGSALLWPIVMDLRQQLAHLPLEVIGLLSTGTFGEAEARAEQKACVHAALREIRHFTYGAVDLSELGLPPEKHGWAEHPYFDQCFLLDEQKRNGTLCRDEDEIIVCTANLLESLLVSDGMDVLVEQVGPDYPLLERRGRFAAVGTANVYIPFHEWSRRNVDQFLLETVESEYLGLSREQDMAAAEAARQSAEQLIESRLQLTGLTQRMVRHCPFRSARAAHRRRQARPVGDLLIEAGQGAPLLDEDSPSQPVPEMEVAPEELRVQLNLWAPDEWLGQLRRHYRGLGLGVAELLGPETGSGGPNSENRDELRVRLALQDWLEAMLAACDTRNDPDFDERRETAPPGVPPRSPSGIVPEFAKRLREEVALLLRGSNRGVITAQAFLDHIGVQLRTSIDRVVDYRTRLSRALESEEAARGSDRMSRHLLRFQRLLDNRPTAGGMIGRSLMLSALIAVVVSYWATLTQVLSYLPPHQLTTWLEQNGDQVWPWISLASGLSVGALVALTAFLVSYIQLRVAISTIERDLARQLNLLINEQILRFLYDEDGRGLLVNLGRALGAQQAAVSRAEETLRRHASELKEALATPIGLRSPAIRQPLPGLEDLREQLMEDAQPDLSDLPSTLLAADPGDAELWLDVILAHDTEIAAAEAGLSSDSEDEIAERYRQATQNYASLGDLLFTAARRIGEQASEITPPADLQITALLEDKISGFTPRTFLADLSRRAQPMLNWDLEELEPAMPVPTDLIVMEQSSGSSALVHAARERRLSAVSSSDPFCISIMQLRHGIPIRAVPQFAACRRAFLQLTSTDRDRLAILRRRLDPDGEYLHRAKEENET